MRIRRTSVLTATRPALPASAQLGHVKDAHLHSLLLRSLCKINLLLVVELHVLLTCLNVNSGILFAWMNAPAFKMEVNATAA